MFWGLLPSHLITLSAFNITIVFLISFSRSIPLLFSPYLLERDQCREGLTTHNDELFGGFQQVSAGEGGCGYSILSVVLGNFLSHSLEIIHLCMKRDTLLILIKIRKNEISLLFLLTIHTNTAE